MTLSERSKLRRLQALYGRQCEGYHNGDPHPASSDPQDKDKNSKLWGKDADATADRFQEYAESLGYKAVFNGIYPSVEKLDGAVSLS